MDALETCADGGVVNGSWSDVEGLGVVLVDLVAEVEAHVGIPISLERHRHVNHGPIKRQLELVEPTRVPLTHGVVPIKRHPPIPAYLLNIFDRIQ